MLSVGHSREYEGSLHRRKYGFVYVTAALFLLSLAGHWILGWEAYLNESREHRQEPEVRQFVIEMGRDTFENWQSEFLQLVWQVAGLALLLHVGSPQSKDGQERLEAKIDYLLSRIDGGPHVREELDALYPRK